MIYRSKNVTLPFPNAPNVPQKYPPTPHKNAHFEHVNQNCSGIGLGPKNWPDGVLQIKY
jgi:hypothetical protein